MSNFTTSPNMGLTIPSVGIDPGPDWANNINASLSVLDGHNHSPESGVQINPNGININSDLAFNGNNSISLRSSRFSIQASPLSAPTDLACVYVSGVDLYYNDANGNQVKITSGGAVNATSSGISSGSATASFVGGVLVVNAAANTPANIQCGSVLIGNNVASSKFLTLAPPNSMAANYQVTLPSLPAATNIVTMDNSGNLAAVTNVDNSTINISSNNIQVKPLGITASQIDNQTITQGKLALRSTGSTVGAGGVAISSASSGSTSGSPLTICSVTLTTTGRPIFVGLAGGTISSGNSGSGQVGELTILNGVTTVSFGEIASTSTGSIAFPANLFGIDTSPAGTYTYSFQIQQSAGGSSITATNVILIAYEL